MNYANHYKIESQHFYVSISMSSNNFLKLYFAYIKMSKDSSAKNYQNNEEKKRLKKSS